MNLYLIPNFENSHIFMKTTLQTSFSSDFEILFGFYGTLLSYIYEIYQKKVEKI